MKRFLITAAAVLFFCISVPAQDYITRKSGEELAVIVEEVGPDYVKYRLYNEPEGTSYVENKTDLVLIRHASGRVEILSDTTPAIAAPGLMKYRQLKKIYNYKEYVPTLYDRHSPGWSGVASFFIPGLGQMICGEVGRGFAWLGGSVACMAAANIFTVAEMPALSLAFSAGALAIDICSIVDGVRVAKVKNMYENDLRCEGYAFDVDLYPSVDYIQTANGVQPTAGMTLAFRF